MKEVRTIDNIMQGYLLFRLLLSPIKESSLSVVVVSGKLEQTLDLTKKNSLQDFFKIIKKIKLPATL